MAHRDPKGERTLVARVSPSGRIDLVPGGLEDGSPLVSATAGRITAAFERGWAEGVLHLGGAELKTPLAPSLSYWREFGRLLVARACRTRDPMAPASLTIPPPDAGELAHLAQAVPPMAGAEFLTEAMLADLWREVGDALMAGAARFSGGLQEFLQTLDPLWNVVGRVCFHLAENKRDPERPFAFVATYLHRLSTEARPQHVPLGRALREYAGERNREKLVALLAPLSRAAQASEFVSQLVDSGQVYHPLAWCAGRAYKFLCDVPLCEEAGLVVRLPDWWDRKRRPRPRVQVTIGENSPARLGMDALLDFSVGLALGGEELTLEECRSLLASTAGLVFLKGRWVEVDAGQLAEVLEHWQDVAEQAGAGGVGFGEALRMVAGADTGALAEESVEQRCPEWSDVVAGKWLAERFSALHAPEVLAEVESNAGLRATLRPYQKLGVQWLWTLRGMQLGACLADDMGLGKTIQVLAVLEMARRRGEEGTDLLVVPASLVDNWRLEFERFAPRLKLLVAHPSRIPSEELKSLPAEAVDGHDAVVTTYGTALRTEWMGSRQWRSVILDEAQAIKNPGARQTQAVKSLRSSWRVALTGTPVENRLGDLWSIFDFLNPGLLGGSQAFGAFCKQMSETPEGYAPLRRLVQPYVLRRLKTDRRVISDLPDKTELTAFCLLSKPQAAQYQAAVDELRLALEEKTGMERRGLVLASLMRFKQICNHPSQWLGDGSYYPEDSGKFQRLRELTEAIAERQDKALVFTQFREMTGPLDSFLTKVFGGPGLVLHGNTPVRKRQELVRNFQEDERVPYMVLSLKAGGTGLNLTAASHVIHFDRWWNPAVENQATDRAFRIGQKKNVLVHKFVCRGTVEERIDDMLKAKQKLSDEVLSGEDTAAWTEMSNEDLLALVSLDINSAMEG